MDNFHNRLVLRKTKEQNFQSTEIDRKSISNRLYQNNKYEACKKTAQSTKKETREETLPMSMKTRKNKNKSNKNQMHSYPHIIEKKGATFTK